MPKTGRWQRRTHLPSKNAPDPGAARSPTPPQQQQQQQQRVGRRPHSASPTTTVTAIGALEGARKSGERPNNARKSGEGNKGRGATALRAPRPTASAGVGVVKGTRTSASATLKSAAEMRRRRNDEREQALIQRLNALSETDCRLPELQSRASVLNHLTKRAGYGLQDQTDLFLGCLHKAGEFLAMLQQHRRMQAHKLALLLDRADEECHRTAQLLEAHFREVDTVHKLVRPDATPAEALSLILARWFEVTRDGPKGTAKVQHWHFEFQSVRGVLQGVWAT